MISFYSREPSGALYSKFQKITMEHGEIDFIYGTKQISMNVDKLNVSLKRKPIRVSKRWRIKDHILSG